MNGKFGLRRALADRMRDEMICKLDQNQHKGDWSNESVEDLEAKACDEYVELLDALEDKRPPREIWREIADVGNFLAMLGDVYERKYSHRAASR